ncbi:AtpZ/AtpI family protein [Falsirhodobacter sp. alg1]|uniref:AtpZ/AtpI family protein n=1 Tax=Falsirhodobacter sp. alg1 TaxID=1472418 RepID=UPI0005F04B3F|nr:AtpZ/AtpI family protein [Falsirhodobacter sp. alg1]
MADEPDTERMRAFEARLAKVRKSTEPKRSGATGEALSAGEVGWRMVTELVAGLLIGFGIGYGLDVLFGTLPLFLVIFTLLGFVAGVRTMMRTASAVQASQTADASAPKEGN